MNTTTPTAPAPDLQRLLQAAEERFPAGTPVMMVNLLRYRDVAAGQPGGGAEPRSGREVYREAYLPAFRRVVAEVGVQGVEIAFAAQVHVALLAPAGQGWDEVLIVRYPDFAAFRRIALSEQYARWAEPLRHAALAELQLYATGLDLPPTG